MAATQGNRGSVHARHQRVIDLTEDRERLPPEFLALATRPSKWGLTVRYAPTAGCATPSQSCANVLARGSRTADRLRMNLGPSRPTSHQACAQVDPLAVLVSTASPPHRWRLPTRVSTRLDEAWEWSASTRKARCTARHGRRARTTRPCTGRTRAGRFWRTTAPAAQRPVTALPRALRAWPRPDRRG
jgi:hypothetical protein